MRGSSWTLLRESSSFHRAESWSLLKECWMKYEVVLEEREMAEHLMAADDKWEPAGEVEGTLAQIKTFLSFTLLICEAESSDVSSLRCLGWLNGWHLHAAWHSAWWVGSPHSASLTALLGFLSVSEGGSGAEKGGRCPYRNRLWQGGDPQHGCRHWHFRALCSSLLGNVDEWVLIFLHKAFWKHNFK